MIIGTTIHLQLFLIKTLGLRQLLLFLLLRELVLLQLNYLTLFNNNVGKMARYWIKNYQNQVLISGLLSFIPQKIKFSIMDFFSKSDQISMKLRAWSHLLKKFSMENFVFCAVFLIIFDQREKSKIKKRMINCHNETNIIFHNLLFEIFCQFAFNWILRY